MILFLIYNQQDLGDHFSQGLHGVSAVHPSMFLLVEAQQHKLPNSAEVEKTE
jgi:hypothetical protein